MEKELEDKKRNNSGSEEQEKIGRPATTEQSGYSHEEGRARGIGRLHHVGDDRAVATDVDVGAVEAGMAEWGL